MPLNVYHCRSQLVKHDVKNLSGFIFSSHENYFQRGCSVQWRELYAGLLRYIYIEQLQLHLNLKTNPVYFHDNATKSMCYKYDVASS